MLDLTGYSLTFDEEFNRLSISQSAGATTWGDIRAQWRGDINADVGFGASSFVDAASGYNPFRVAGGALTITAVPDRTPYGVPTSWETGLITTQGSFSQIYGYFEIRADFSNQPGAWDAFWLLPDRQIPDPNGAGRWQELDVVEHYGSWDRGVYSGIHTTDPAPNEHWQKYLQVYSEMRNPDGYHTYGMNWQADRTSFYVDGQLVGSQATPSDMHGPMYLLANLATQRSDFNNADAAGVPISSSIDYIRVYANTPGAVAVGLDTISSPDGRDPGLYGARAAAPSPLTALALAPTAGNDILAGTEAADLANLLAGDDVWRGGRGNDTAVGGDGNDLIYGNQDNDLIYGNQGADTLFGGQGDDRAFGGQGNDVVYGNLGADLLHGGQGDDVLYGGQGADTLVGGAGTDVLVGGLGADLYVLGAEAGRDLIVGFNPAEGDRIDLGGQGFAVGSAPDGSAVLTLAGGGVVVLAGLGADAVGAGFFAAR